MSKQIVRISEFLVKVMLAEFAGVVFLTVVALLTTNTFVLYSLAFLLVVLLFTTIIAFIANMVWMGIYLNQLIDNLLKQYDGPSKKTT